MILLTLMLALTLDYLLGEPKRFHPLVGFGNLARAVEGITWAPTRGKLRGAIALAILLFLTLALVFVLLNILPQTPLINLLSAAFALYLTIAPKSLAEHARAVSNALSQKSIEESRQAIAMIVSRDTEQLTETEIAVACCESILENGSDAVFAAIFWFCFVAFIFGGSLSSGVYAVVLYRVVNTLDAMWGYKNTRYFKFGYFSAKLDDWLNYIPARLVALSYGLVGNFPVAMDCMWNQGRNWKSPNAGMVMAAGAGSLQIQLGGRSTYSGQCEERPVLGCERLAQVDDIQASLNLVKRTLMLWLVVVAVLTIV